MMIVTYGTHVPRENGGMIPASPFEKGRSELHNWLPPEVRERLTALEEQVVVPAGTALITHDIPPSHLIILNSGRAEISLKARGKAVSLGTCGRGSVFDLRALVCGVAPSVDVVALDDCHVSLVPGGEFSSLLQQHPEAYFAVAKVLSNDLKLANEALRRLLLTPMRGFRRARPVVTVFPSPSP